MDRFLGVGFERVTRCASSVSTFCWGASGNPQIKTPLVDCEVICATCGTQIKNGVPLNQVETPTMSNHADYFRFGTKFICQPCAWFFDIGKGRPGNFLATPDKLEYLVISLESLVTDKKTWLQALQDLEKMPDSTAIAGLMTTDVKPRLWPRTRLSTVGNFGLYVHAPEYDVSEWRNFDLRHCVKLIDKIIEPLTIGYSKSSVYHGLFRDYARSQKNPDLTMELECVLSSHRNHAYFLPALIAAGVTKESKKDVKSTNGFAQNIKPRATIGDCNNKTQLGLF